MEELIEKPKIKLVNWRNFDSVMLVLAEDNKENRRSSNKGYNKWCRSRLVREDKNGNKFETLQIHTFTEDGNKELVYEIAWCDDDNNILPLDDQSVINRHVEIIEMNEALEERFKQRHINIISSKDVSNDFESINREKIKEINVKEIGLGKA